MSLLETLMLLEVATASKGDSDMAIEAGSSTYHQAKRGIPNDNLVFYVDPSIKDSYRNIGDSKIYSLVNSNHYMDITSGSNYKRGRRNCGIEYTGGSGFGTMSVAGLASNYGMSMNNATYILYAKCGQNVPVSGGAFSNWIIQIGSYYGNNSFGLGLQSNSLMVYIRGSNEVGWTYASGTGSTNQLIYTNNIGNWIFYVVRFIGNDAVKVHLNNTQCWNVSNLSNPFTGIASNYMYLGRNQQETVGLFAVYDAALSDAEVSDFYNATRHRFGL